MRKLYCYSLYQFKKLVTDNNWDVKLPENVAIISIINSPKIALEDEVHILPSSDRVLNLDFDDVTPYDSVLSNVVLFNEEMASKSYEFIKNNIKAGCNFFIHCSAGVSRSQAFIKFIKDNWPEYNWATLKNNPCLYPNFHVVGLLNAEFRKENKWDYINN